MGFKRVIAAGLGPSVFRPGSPESLALLRAVWPSVVGPELGRRTVVVGLVENTLRIGVPDGRWRTALHKLHVQILCGLRDAVGAVAPRRLGFVEGVVPPPEATPEAKDDASTPRPAPEVVAASAQAIADPDIRAAFLETAARYLARAARRPTAPKEGQ